MMIFFLFDSKFYFYYSDLILLDNYVFPFIYISIILKKLKGDIV